MSEHIATSTTRSAAHAQALDVAREELLKAAEDLRVTLGEADREAMLSLHKRVSRIRGALTVIGKPATAWLAEEVQDLLKAIRDQALPAQPASDELEQARVLLESIDMLDTAVASIEQGSHADTALPWLDVVNDMRSLRGDPLVADSLVLAIGIDVDGLQSFGSTGSSEAGIVWQTRWIDHKPRIMRALIDWIRAANAQDEAECRQAAGALADRFAELLADVLEPLTGNSNTVPYEMLMLQSSEAVARAVFRGMLTDRASLRRLYGLIVQQLSLKSDGVDLGLLRNVLYYLALAGKDESARHSELEVRFELPRVRAAIEESSTWKGAAPGMSRRLSDSLHERALTHLQPFESWLETGALWSEQQSADARLLRLRELDAMLRLFGQNTAREVLGQITARVESLEKNAVVDDQTRLALAESVLRLRNLLERQRGRSSKVRQEVERAADNGSPSVELSGRALAERIARTGSPIDSDTEDAVYAQEAAACLISEARRRLREVEPAMDGRVAGPDEDEVPLPVVTARIRSVSRALDILPLPEASVLIDGLADAVEIGAPSSNMDFRRAVARLVVEIDACLEGFSVPGLVRDDALDRAQSALVSLRSALPAKRLLEGVFTDSTQHDALVTDESRIRRLPGDVAKDVPREVPRDRDQRALTEAALTALDEIGERLHDTPLVVSSLQDPLRTLERIGRRGGHRDLSRVCGAALDRIETSDGDLPKALLDQLHAVLPQLIAGLYVGAGTGADGDASRGSDQSQGGIDDLDDLVQALRPDHGLLPETDSLFLTSDTQLAGASLRSVFVSECTTHLNTLDAELAVRPVMASKALLRALHTLGGSAQTVGADTIVTVAEPMQQLASERHAQGKAFSAGDIEALERSAAHVRQLLDKDWTEPATDASAELHQVHQSPGQPQFVDASERGPGAKQTHQASSLADVFADEARELIARLRVDAGSASSADAVRERCLSALHTLKGSARVAGWPGLAERAHEHEAVLQQASSEVLADAVDCARRELGAAAPGVSDSRSVPDAAVVVGDTRVSEDSWDRLIALSSDVSASQARLTVEIDRLSAAARELEAATHRWRRLPTASHLLESEAARELLADVNNVRAALDTALRGVDAERRLGARAGRALQQDLVRARLVRFGDAAARLHEVVRDASVTLEVEATLTLSGGHTTVDGALYRRLLPAVEQLLRNAVMHGIEKPEVRRAAGKPDCGQISITAQGDALDLVLRVVDDGRGLAEGVSSLVQLEQSGYSTARELASARAQLGGHGLGLASIRQLMTELGGDVRLLPVAEGACFELRVPQPVPVQQIVLVEAGGMFGIPVNFVREIVPVDADTHALELAALLGMSNQSKPVTSREQDDSTRRCIVLVSHDREVSVTVDAVAGYREVVVQPVGQQLGTLGCYAGAAALADGRCALLLSPSAWLEPPSTASSSAPVVAQARPVVLVADDSPTQRAWLQEQLERWGVRVVLARDGQEALDTLRGRAVDLVLLDIDMPRVDGFSVLDTLRGVDMPMPPILMVTSRSSARDRDAALRLGAAELLAKPVAADTLRKSLEVHIPTLTAAL